MKNIPFHSTALSKTPVPRVESMDRGKKNATLSNTSYASATQRPQRVRAALPSTLHGHAPRALSRALHKQCPRQLPPQRQTTVHVHEALCKRLALTHIQ